MNISTNSIELIGNTPIVELCNFDIGLCRLFVKLECQNPGGSLKDRTALWLINEAEREGKIHPGDTLVEATSGNTALGLAFVGNQRGYKSLIVVTEKISQEKLAHIKALGAEVVVTRCDYKHDHPEYYQNLARRLAHERKNSFYTEQFLNPANPLAHERTTGPEIWEQMHHDVDAIVCGIGTGGHFTGVGRFMKKVAPHLQMIIADPEGSILEPYFRTGKIEPKGKWLIEGIGEDAVIHPNMELSLASAAYAIPDAESFAVVRELLKKEAIFGGPSSGTVVAAALRYCRAQTTPKKVVTFIYDDGTKYLSKMYNDEWLKRNGLKF